MYGQALTPTEDTECARVGRGAWQGAPKSGRGKRDLGRGTYGAYSGGGVLGTTSSNMSSRVRTSSRRRALTCQKRRARDEERGEGGELGFGRRHDGWGCASIDCASWGEGKGNGKGRSSTFSRGGAAICTNGAARNCALPRCVGAGSSRGHGKHRLHVPATFQLGIATPAASGGEGSCSGFATQACESLASEIRAERGRAELMNRRGAPVCRGEHRGGER